jgi:hypothetical protein
MLEASVKISFGYGRIVMQEKRRRLYCSNRRYPTNATSCKQFHTLKVTDMTTIHCQFASLDVLRCLLLVVVTDMTSGVSGMYLYFRQHCSFDLCPTKVLHHSSVHVLVSEIVIEAMRVNEWRD